MMTTDEYMAAPMLESRTRGADPLDDEREQRHIEDTA
jgi:hypothetical protein